MKYDVKWGDGCSDMFIEVKDGKPVLLDYEYDTERLHEMCGGRCYYASRSGASGAGYFNSLGSLIPLGSYRVDTVHNDSQHFLPVAPQWSGRGEGEILVAVPYVSHENDKSETLRSRPTVIKVGNKVIYTDFEANLMEVISLLLAGKDLPEECVVDGVSYNRRGHHTLRRTFTWLNDWGSSIEEEEVILEHYNLCSMNNPPSPWEFFRRELEKYQAGWTERIFQLLSVEQLENGTFVKTVKIDHVRYRGGILPGNPLETGDLTAGWQRVDDDVIVRFYDRSNEAHLVTYARADEAYGKLSQRLAAKMGEGEEFIPFVSAHNGEYVEYEMVVPKVLYLINPAAQQAEARRGLARKVRYDVTRRARLWVDQVNDQSLLEMIPDDLVVTFGDSLDAGNCRPGTEAFVAQYFPGQVQTTAGELKKHADNYNVMRIFRHLAATGRFDCKIKALPDDGLRRPRRRRHRPEEENTTSSFSENDDVVEE